MISSANLWILLSLCWEKQGGTSQLKALLFRVYTLLGWAPCSVLPTHPLLCWAPGGTLTAGMDATWIPWTKAAPPHWPHPCLVTPPCWSRPCVGHTSVLVTSLSWSHTCSGLWASDTQVSSPPAPSFQSFLGFLGQSQKIKFMKHMVTNPTRTATQISLLHLNCSRDPKDTQLVTHSFTVMYL